MWCFHDAQEEVRFFFHQDNEKTEQEAIRAILFFLLINGRNGGTLI